MAIHITLQRCSIMLQRKIQGSFHTLSLNVLFVIFSLFYTLRTMFDFSLGEDLMI